MSEKQNYPFVLDDLPILLYFYDLEFQLQYRNHKNYENQPTFEEKMIDYLKKFYNEESESLYYEFALQEQDHFFQFYSQKIENGFLLAGTDITKKTNLVQEATKAIIRNKAKFFIERIKTRNLKLEYEELNKILEQFDSTVMIIDPYFNVSVQNNDQKLSKCYEFFGLKEKCKDCIFDTGIPSRSHEQDNMIFTEKKFEMEHNKFLLTFDNTTKEVTLLRQIKRQQEELNYQKNIFQLINELGVDAIKKNNLRELLQSAVKRITVFFKLKKFSIILHNERGVIYEEEKFGFSQNEVVFNTGNLTEYIKSLQKIEIVPLIKGSIIIGTILHEHLEKSEMFISFLRIYQDQLITAIDNIKLQEQLEELANLDSLTGFYNRNYLERNIERFLSNSIRFHQPLGIVLIDLNGLKRVNDVFGHASGDRLIKECADVLKRALRNTDVKIRLGGDEFLILLFATNQSKMKFTERRLKEESGKYTIDFDGELQKISYSVGCASSMEVTDFKKLYLLADKRMYAHKEEFYKSNEKYR